MKIKQYLLNEERLKDSDRKQIEKLIDKPKNTTFVLKSFSKNYSEDEREVDVSKAKDGITFEYNADHFELTNVLVDICDENEYRFNTDTERPVNTTYFKVIK